MQLITISGLDGSGKTTQLEQLKQHLEKQGKKVYHFHIIDFSIANKLFSLQKKIPLKPAKSVTHSGNFAITLRKIALSIDIIRFNQLFSNLSKDYDCLITDRYFYDQIVNIHYLENSAKIKILPLWQKIAEKFIKKPTFGIFIEVSAEIAISRDREIDQGMQFLIDKQRIFDKFIKNWKVEKINGEGTVKEVFEKILANMGLPIV